MRRQEHHPSLTLWEHSAQEALVVRRIPTRDSEYALRNWHYIHAGPPAFITDCYGAWEYGRYIGAILYGHTCTTAAARSFPIAPPEQFGELRRVALDVHETPTTSILARTYSLLRQDHPEWSVLIAYSDPGAGHTGGLYRAASWRDMGCLKPMPGAFRTWIINGQAMSNRQIWSRCQAGEQDTLRRKGLIAWQVNGPPKRRFLKGLTKQARKAIMRLPDPEVI